MDGMDLRVSKSRSCYTLLECIPKKVGFKDFGRIFTPKMWGNGSNLILTHTIFSSGFKSPGIEIVNLGRYQYRLIDSYLVPWGYSGPWSTSFYQNERTKRKSLSHMGASKNRGTPKWIVYIEWKT